MDSTNQGFTVHDFNAANHIATDALPRDRAQSHRLHEPEHIRTSIDPITGHDITDFARRPTVIDGNVTIYFETEKTRQLYLDTPIDHPFHLVDNPTGEGYDEG